MKFKKFMNNNYTQISLYVIVVATIIFAIKGVIGSAPFFFDVIFDKIGWIIGASQPIILALVFTYLLDPVADFFEESYRKIKIFKNKYKLCRALAVLTVCVILVFAITAIISLLVSSITEQIKIARFDDVVNIVNSSVDTINNTYNDMVDKIGKSNIESLELKQYLTSVAEYVLTWLKSAGLGILASITGITSFFTNLFLAFIMMIYFLLDERLLKFHLRRIIKAFMKDETYSRFKIFADTADEVFSGYIRGQCIDACIMAVMISVTLSIVGVKMAVVIGICSGIGNLIPYVGPIVAYVSTTLVCLINGDMKGLIIALIALIIIQLLDGNVIGPKLLSNAVAIHPLIVIISIVFGSAVGGLLGMLLAVPVGALVKVLFMRYVDGKLTAKGQNEELLTSENKNTNKNAKNNRNSNSQRKNKR